MALTIIDHEDDDDDDDDGDDDDNHAARLHDNVDGNVSLTTERHLLLSIHPISHSAARMMIHLRAAIFRRGDDDDDYDDGDGCDDDDDVGVLMSMLKTNGNILLYGYQRNYFNNYF